MGVLLLIFEEKFIYSFSFYNLLKRRRLDLAEKFWGFKSKAIFDLLNSRQMSIDKGWD